MWDLQGTESQRRVAAAGLARCSFPWESLREGLAKVGRSAIPVEWADLSRYASALAAGKHHHVHEGEDVGHPIEARGRVLGLAWYSGKVSLDLSLEHSPPLAHEVLLAEGAHMVDFFRMTPRDREQLYLILHEGDATPHDHGWFEETGNHDYWSWVGEAWMAMFCLAYSDVTPTLTGFVHQARPEMVPAVRALLTPNPEAKAEPYFAMVRSSVFHDDHRKVAREIEFSTYQDALASGRRPCGVCKPREEVTG